MEGGDLVFWIKAYFRRRRKRRELALWFKEINKVAFDGYLTETEFKIDDLRDVGCIGRYIHYRTMKWKPIIEVHDTLVGWGFVEVIFHEMIHHFQYESGWNDKRDPHGALFIDDYDKRIGKVKAMFLTRETHE